MKVRQQQENKRTQAAHAAAAAAGVAAAAATQEPPRPYHCSFSSYGGPPVTTARWSDAANEVLYHHDQQQQNGCNSSIGSVSSISTNSSAGCAGAGGGHRRSRRRRRTKKNGVLAVGGNVTTTAAASKRTNMPAFLVKGTNRHLNNITSSTTMQSSSSCNTAATSPLTASTAHNQSSSSGTSSSSSSSAGSSSSSSSSCSKKQHDAPMTKRDLYFSLRCGMVGIGPTQAAATAAGTAVFEQQSAVGRVTVVNWENQVVLDTLVRVPVPVTDYRTHCTELTKAHDLSINNKAALSLEVVRTQVAALLKGKILIGHGLEVDLAALGLSHPWCDVRDTATYLPYMKKIVTDPMMTAMMLPRDLQDLLNYFLGRQLSWSSTTNQHPQQQQPSRLVMEAIGCLDLYKIKRHEWEAELILLLRQKQRQRQVMLDMRNSAATGTQLTSITELVELSSTDGTSIPSASGDGGRFRTQYELLKLRAQQQYQEEENNGHHSPPLHYSSFEEKPGVWKTYEDSSTMASTMGTSAYARQNNSDGGVSLTSAANIEDDVSAASSYHLGHQDHHDKSRGTSASHPPRFVHGQQQQDTPTRATTSNVNTWRTCNVAVVDFENDLDDSWLLNSEHGGSGIGTIGGSDSGHNIWSPPVPTATTSSSSVSSSPVPQCNTTSPKGIAPDWSIGPTAHHSNHAGAHASAAALPGFGPWQEQRQAGSVYNVAANATPTTSLSEEQVMEHLVSNLLDLDCVSDFDDEDDRFVSTPSRSVTTLDSSMSLSDHDAAGGFLVVGFPTTAATPQPTGTSTYGASTWLVNC